MYRNEICAHMEAIIALHLKNEKAAYNKVLDTNSEDDREAYRLVSAQVQALRDLAEEIDTFLVG